LGALAIVAYPIGFFAYWVQIWSEYTHDPTTALYAAALIPVPVAVGRAVGVLVVAVVAGSISTGAASGFAYFKFFSPLYPAEESSRFVGFAFRFAFSRFGRAVFFISTVATSASAPLVFQLVVLESASDIFFYACAGIIAGASGLIGMWLILGSHPDEGPDLRSGVPGIITIATGTIIAAMFLIPLQSAPLAKVHFSDAADCDARLIAHSVGYWYVVERGKTDVIALPDESVGEVTITEQ
jgi:hypothetical protein